MKRFWKSATVSETANGFAVTLDGRSIKTPMRNALIVPTHALAQAIAAEWDAQGEQVDPAAMPLTRLTQGACDEVAADRDRIIGRIAAWGESDMLCYRADAAQAELAAEQAAQWDPLLDWARTRYDVSFAVVDGIMHEAQPAATIVRLREAVAAKDDFTLAAMLELVGLAGSLVIVLAQVEGAFDADDLWQRANLEELWQERQWGVDEEASSSRQMRYMNWSNAVDLLSYTPPRTV